MRGIQKFETLEVFERIAGVGSTCPTTPASCLCNLRAPRGQSHLDKRPLRTITGRSHPAALTVPATAAADIVAAATDEVSADSFAARSGLRPGVADLAMARTLEIARAATGPALDVFAAARRIRPCMPWTWQSGHAARAFCPTCTSSPGQATALMASGAFDLNRWDESDALAKSAVSYASLAGHSSLQAWTVGLAALLANWRCEPDIALSH